MERDHRILLAEAMMRVHVVVRRKMIALSVMCQTSLVSFPISKNFSKRARTSIDAIYL